MSGHYSKSMYDSCAASQYTEAATRKNRLWDFEIAKFENRPTTNKLAKCGSKHQHIECSKCNCRRTYSEGVPSTFEPCRCDESKKLPCKNCPHNSDSDLDNTRSANIKYRVNAENDLLGLTRPLSNCDSKKHIPCWTTKLGEYGNFKTNTNSCKSHKIIAQPLLCDRAINPTNVHKFTGWDTYE
jgi:hypothetical protein